MAPDPPAQNLSHRLGLAAEDVVGAAEQADPPELEVAGREHRAGRQVARGRPDLLRAVRRGKHLGAHQDTDEHEQHAEDQAPVEPPGRAEARGRRRAGQVGHVAPDVEVCPRIVAYDRCAPRPSSTGQGRHARGRRRSERIQVGAAGAYDRRIGWRRNGSCSSRTWPRC